MTLKLNIAALLLFLSLSVFAQSPPQDWFHLDAKRDNYNGVSANKAYDDIVQGKSGKTIVVAVIDSGIDVEHEDLKDVIWVNTDEIPDNNIDDDKNGYVDDIHGWNFIGGKDGQNVGADTYEVTRVYAKYKYKYENADPDKLTKKQKKEYALYLEAKEEVENKLQAAKNNIDRVKQNETMVMGAIDAVAEALGDNEPTAENLEAIESDDNQPLTIGKNILNGMLAQEGEIESIDAVKEEIKKQLNGAYEYYGNQIEYAYNTEFKPRTIVGDNYNDSYEKGYGNNDYEGPDAFHGTHVAGIIGASRNNDVGMNGIATNVRIMSVRAVPDGDERDKDVANAIIYAVDNGASIINMSFGKAYSWDKEAVDKAVKYAMKKDVLLVHAAGNSSQDNDTANNFPNDSFDKKGLFCKKNADNWIEVGALNYKQGEDLPAPFSNYGSNNVDLFAPGMAIYSTTPDNNYQNAQGTSMASPVVAGVAAVLRSQYPALNAKQVKEILMESSVPMTDMVKKPGSDEKVGFNTLSKSGGVVNLYNALEMAKNVKGKKKVKDLKA